MKAKVGGVLVLVTVLITAFLSAQSAPRQANLWIDANGGTCAREASPADYVDGAACSSVQAAFTAASCGDVVRVKAGVNYGAFQINTGSKACDDNTLIVFRPEDDRENTFGRAATVKTSGISVTTPDAWAEFQDFDLFTDPGVTAGAMNAARSPVADAHVVFRRVDAQIAFVRMNDVSIIGGSVGGFEACDFSFDDAIVFTHDGTTPAARGLVDGVYIHDITRTGCSDHADSIQLLGGIDHTIRNNTFVNGPTEAIIARPGPDTATLSGLTIENNMIGDTGGTQSINVGSGVDICSDITVRFNSTSEAITLDCVGSGNTVNGNITTACGITGATVTNNIGANCGTPVRRCTPAWKNGPPGTTGDFHLAATDACARGQGTGSAPATDIDGDPRPLGALDIGADEVE